MHPYVFFRHAIYPFTAIANMLSPLAPLGNRLSSQFLTQKAFVTLFMPWEVNKSNIKIIAIVKTRKCAIPEEIVGVNALLFNRWRYASPMCVHLWRETCLCTYLWRATAVILSVQLAVTPVRAQLLWHRQFGTKYVKNPQFHSSNCYHFRLFFCCVKYVITMVIVINKKCLSTFL